MCCSPTDCVGSWLSWSECRVDGVDFADASLPQPRGDPSSATRSRTYVVLQEAANGGQACGHSDGEVETEACSPVVTNFVDWTFQSPLKELRLVVCPLGGAVHFQWNGMVHDVYEMNSEAE